VLSFNRLHCVTNLWIGHSYIGISDPLQIIGHVNGAPLGACWRKA
jgi:hypothetical protein